MPRGTVLRKIIVLNRIEELPEEQREHVYYLYAILDRIEWFKVLPYYLSLIAIIAMPLLATYLGDIFLVNEFVSLLCGLVIAALCYTGLVYLLRKFVFTGSCKKQVEKLRNTLSDQKYIAPLQIIKELDPDITRNISKYLVQIP